MGGHEEAVFAANVGLALRAARVFGAGIPGVEPDDVRQESLLAMWRSLQTWRPELGRLSPYVWEACRRRLLTLRRTMLRRRLCRLGEASVIDRRDPLAAVEARLDLDALGLTGLLAAPDEAARLALPPPEDAEQAELFA